jgi:N-methylhydantoinase A/oxoprolinase/acetone carboxylase beta subunit
MSDSAGWELRVRMEGGAPAASILSRATGELRLVEPVSIGRYPRIGIVLIGYAESTARRIGDAPAMLVGGQIDVTGEELSPVDAAGLETGFPAFVSDNELDAVVVSGMNSPMNPAHEAGAARCCRDRAKVPMLEARHLGAERNAVERVRQGIAATRGLMFVTKLLAEIPKEKQTPDGTVRIVGLDTNWAGA